MDLTIEQNNRFRSKDIIKAGLRIQKNFITHQKFHVNTLLSLHSAY